MYGKRIFRRRRKFIRRRKVGRRGRSSVPARFKRYVKRAIHRQIENKERSYYAVNTSITISDSVTGTYPLIVSSVQGTNEEQRIGNQIKVVRGQIKLAINLLPYNATTNPNANPVWVRVMVVRDLVYAYQATTMQTNTYNNIFRAGSTSFTFGGNPLDMVATPNKDIIRVLYNKVFKLGCASAYVAGAPTTGASYFDNSPAAKCMTINWGKWVKKQLKFSDNSSNVNNDNLYLVIQAVNADGTSCSGKSLIEWHYQNTMQFEDA